MKPDSPCSLYLRRLAPSGRKSVASQLKQMKHILEWSGTTEKQPFHLLTYGEVESIKHTMIDNGKSARTINLALNAIKGVVKTGFLMDITPDNVWLKVQAVKSVKTTPSSRGSALTSFDVKKLLLDCSIDKRPIGLRDSAILAVFLSSGARRFELSNFKLDSFNIQKQTIEIKAGKGRKTRCQNLPIWVTPYIDAWLKFRGHEQGFLFNPFRSRIPNPVHQMSASAIYRVVKSRTEMTLEKSSAPHDLRRTFITQLLRQNVDLSTASKLAGHASLATTQIYDKRDEAVTREAALSLSFKE